ncbi:MAG: type II secretion system protein [Candidatus Omnitrophota bacterium]
MKTDKIKGLAAQFALPRCLSRKGFTLVEIMIVVAIIVLLAAMTVPNLLRSRLTANDAAALRSLKGLSTALETYAVSNNSKYPAAATFDALKATDFGKATPPYMSTTAIDALRDNKDGHDFLIAASVDGYQIVANVSKFKNTGIKHFKISTGGVVEEKVANSQGNEYTAVLP